MVDDQLKQRFRRSPDLADALALTFAIEDMPANVSAQLGHGDAGGGKMLSVCAIERKPTTGSGRSTSTTVRT